MQALIETTSDLYAKRLVKAIRTAFEHGVYLSFEVANTQSNPRLSSVRFSADLSRIICATNKGHFLVSADHWEHAFFDGYGREIYASRRQS